MKLECCKCAASAKIESFSRDKRYIGVVKCLNPECDNVFVGPIVDSLYKATQDIENKAVESGLFRKEYTTYDYYWEKAEFQDEWSHRQHVENYKKGVHSSIAFDEQYMKEAQEELEREKFNEEMISRPLEEHEKNVFCGGESDMNKYYCDRMNESLILEPEDWSSEEWKVILKLFGMVSAERIEVADYLLKAYGERRSDWNW